MEGGEGKSLHEWEQKLYHIFSEFLARAAKFEELVAIGSRLLAGFQQALEVLRRPPINKTSKLVEGIVKANETKRLKSYIEAGCINTHDGVQNMSKLHTCQRGLQDHLSKVQKFGLLAVTSLKVTNIDHDVAYRDYKKARRNHTSIICSLQTANCILNELNCLIEDAAEAVQSANGDSSDILNEENSSFDARKAEVTEFAVMMAVIYRFLKQDYMMQERIVSSLSLKSSFGELESYCLMWSLRPFLNDEIMQQAWKLIR